MAVITNCAKHLATLVVRDFAIDPAILTWIEHLPNSQVQFSITISFEMAKKRLPPGGDMSRKQGLNNW